MNKVPITTVAEELRSQQYVHDTACAKVEQKLDAINESFEVLCEVLYCYMLGHGLQILEV